MESPWRVEALLFVCFGLLSAALVGLRHSVAVNYPAPGCPHLRGSQLFLPVSSANAVDTLLAALASKASSNYSRRRLAALSHLTGDDCLHRQAQLAIGHRPAAHVAADWCQETCPFGPDTFLSPFPLPLL